MSVLNLSGPTLDSALEPPAPPRPKRAWLAFVLSLVVPGSGQMYAGRVNQGVCTLLVFALSLLVTIAAFGQTVGGYAFVAADSLYIYGILDAYFGVLERNAGLASVISGRNPRTATALNFMTSGFGYFYLGERAKGVVMFLMVGVLRTVLGLAFPKSP